MTRSITAFEAPALVDAHSNVTKLELYERLQGKTMPKGAAGLASFVAQGAMEFAAQDAGWRKLSKHERTRDIAGIRGYSNGWTTADEDGEFVATFQHVPQYMHTISWAKAGVPSPIPARPMYSSMMAWWRRARTAGPRWRGMSARCSGHWPRPCPPGSITRRSSARPSAG